MIHKANFVQHVIPTGTESPVKRLIFKANHNGKLVLMVSPRADKFISSIHDYSTFVIFCPLLFPFLSVVKKSFKFQVLIKTATWGSGEVNILYVCILYM